jgi:hypothetical protein
VSGYGDLLKDEIYSRLSSEAQSHGASSETLQNLDEFSEDIADSVANSLQQQLISAVGEAADAMMAVANSFSAATPYPGDGGAQMKEQMAAAVASLNAAAAGLKSAAEAHG